jgi:RHS repeat-associated protein
VNAIGQRTGVATSGTAFPAVPSWAWSYDSLGQVIAADSSVATSDRSYQYDTIGNRQKSADSLTLPVANNYSANLLNQYSAINNQQSSVINPSYDFDGNATAYPMPAAPATNSSLAWDAENRLISSTVGTATTTYQYDAQSRRIAKVAGTSATTSTATLYLYDAWNCLAEYERGTGVSPVLTLKKTRLWGTDLSGTPQGAGGVAGLLSESLISNPQSPIYYPTYDGNGNISEYLTATGTLAAHFEYDPFGNTVVNTDTGNLFPYRFSTKPRDQETGLHYYGYRYYDPMTGRWPSRDPIQEDGGVNLYGFVGNNGVNKLDTLGLHEIKDGPQKYSWSVSLTGFNVLSGDLEASLVARGKGSKTTPAEITDAKTKLTGNLGGSLGASISVGGGGFGLSATAAITLENLLEVDSQCTDAGVSGPGMKMLTKKYTADLMIVTTKINLIWTTPTTSVLKVLEFTLRDTGCGECK